jgi:hypothetical protein
MDILVCVKYVPDSTADRRFEDDATVDRAGVDGLLSELDEYAVEQALQLKEKGNSADGESTVTVLTVGPESATDAIRKALQMGADKGVHVLDDAIAGSDAVGTSLVLAKAVEKVGAWDLLVCGMASTDGSMGVVPVMVAERLGVPAVTLGSEVEVDGSTVRIRRDGDVASPARPATRRSRASWPRRRSRWKRGRLPTSVWTPSSSGCPRPGPRSRAPRPVRPARPGRSCPTRTERAPRRSSSSSRRRSSSDPERSAERRAHA